MNQSKTYEEMIYELTPMDVWLTFAYAVFRIFLSVGWLYLAMSNIAGGNRVLGVVFGLVAVSYIYETINWWRRWWGERKQLAARN